MSSRKAHRHSKAEGVIREDLEPVKGRSVLTDSEMEEH